MFLLDSDEMTENMEPRPASDQMRVIATDGAVFSRAAVAGVAGVSAALLMTELALTRIFSVTMYYHFAFLAISIALFGLSASGVAVYLARKRLDRVSTSALLA